jgi:hypothetical protein
MERGVVNKQGGFIKTIFLIVVLLLLMKYFEVTFTDMWNWVKMIFGDFF